MSKREEIWKVLESEGYTRNGGTPQATPQHGSAKVVTPKPPAKPAK